MMRHTIDLALHERGILLEDGVAVRALGPGRHVVWALWRKIEVVRYDTRALVVDMPGEHARLIDASELATVVVGEHERALVLRRGRPQRWLGAGVHLVWTVDRIEVRGAEQPKDGRAAPVGAVSAVRIEILDVGALAADPLRDDVRALVAAGDYTEVLVPDGHVALRVVDGAVDAELGPGRHAAWTVRRKVSFLIVDLRERILAVTGQDVLTRDKVSLRLNVSAAWKIVDARLATRAAKSAEEALYLALQLALRETTAGHALDELLARRELLVESVLPGLKARANALGLELLDVGVRDLVLPGEMKALLNRVIEAQKEAEANVILRREETAATRSLAQTAKVLGENPLLVRLKELEAYKELAAQIGTVHVVMGEGGLGKLELKV
jgi:regulator of protease activity HflC (stomatin/prohibitin superfamily)